MAASYDPDPNQYLGIRLPVTFDTCEVIEDRWGLAQFLEVLAWTAGARGAHERAARPLGAAGSIR